MVIEQKALVTNMDTTLHFFKGKKVLITGHTGFKGSWLSTVLVNAGAEVIGYSTCREKEISLFKLSGIENQIVHIKGDIRDLDHLKKVFDIYKPEIVIHMAAQPIVLESYEDPVTTYETNTMGTVNICEAIRHASTVRSFINVTTDKVYENHEWVWGYRENESLNGYDPYSNSKSCSELVTDSYNRSFLRSLEVGVSTVRAGNVIGGGDFARNRIIPDCVRAAQRQEPIILRNPYSVRPYQHVLEALNAYLLVAVAQYRNINYSSSYNVGPDEADCIDTKTLVDLFIKHWGNEIKSTSAMEAGPHEANFLKLDCSKLKATFGWKPRWNIDTAVGKVVEWSKSWLAGENVRTVMNAQISEFFS